MTSSEQEASQSLGDSLRVKVDRDVLAEAVSWVARSLPQRPATPVLTGILLEAHANGELKLAAFDYEVSARVTVSAEVEQAGRILVSGKLLADITKAMPAKPVLLATEAQKLDVSGGSSRFSLATMPVDTYPELPQLPETVGVAAGSSFQEAVSQVTIATSKDDTLPILSGVRVEIEGENITLLATDRYRLAVREFTWRPSRPDFSAVALVRGRTLSEVSKTLGGEVEVSLSSHEQKGLIAFSSGGRVSTSLLVEGEYPKVRSLFPQQVPITAVVDRASLLEAVRRVALVAERNTPIRFIFTEGDLTLQAGTGDDAQASEALPADLRGEAITVGFNPGYIIEGLSAIDKPFVRFSFTQQMKPVVIGGQPEQTGDEDLSYRYLLMPIRI
ncbi:DNA polymerase III subunit beta [Sediminivirga luteola]|uniref:Beta sliding clamp n=1 Tax=Sediminivirga luteola TaxID=1774748 RepID=A0A8J2XLR2_9MICO|nr:DNA polymerase III subunit beta [Sediminivirga luteola]MCI2266629.1 DNA polymerase III subunit beta [Sediminivirga luteola]GGA20170.1 DNA polymerase III subunit beta [Sediminivirga luteola]